MIKRRKFLGILATGAATGAMTRAEGTAPPSKGMPAPTLKLVAQGTGANVGPSGRADGKANSSKFTIIGIADYFNASPSDFGPREQAKVLGGESARDGLVRMPAGRRDFRGIPFWLGPEGMEKKSRLVLSTRTSSWTTPKLEIPLQKKAGYICLASFCDWDESETRPPHEDVIEKVGQHLGDAVLVYEDGREHVCPLRRRFEVGSPSFFMHPSFASLPHLQDAPRKLTDSLRKGTDWGALQFGISEQPPTTLWICAIPNPYPELMLKAFRIEAKDADPLIVCGITLFHGITNPLRYERLSLYRVTLPEATAEEEDRWKVAVDLGVVARTFVLGDFEPDKWLSAPNAGLGERAVPRRGSRHIYAQVTASPEATLVLTDTKLGKTYGFDLGPVALAEGLEEHSEGARIEILERKKVWVHGRVLDAGTHRPTPVRLAFRSKEGQYIPPYGHRTEINDGVFQDYGTDVKLMDSSFAYVDGTFQVELPVGEVYVEMTKGFEYGAMRRRLNIDPAQRELNLEISRFADYRSQGWVSADTHVHFLPPSTAVLEGQAEGLNLINLLAAQWGDLFTNVGDFFQGSLTSRDGEMMVRVGTENRQHILGHLGLLGGRGAPVYPMSATAGVGTGYLGDPLWSSLSDWADACRKREGLVVAAHFPYPNGELAADIVLGKFDAVELFPYGEHFNTLMFLDWYRYLNCGYRLPAVGGTDKAGAYMAVGANRTYAYLGQEEFNFASWAKAVRKGNTFMTTGPLLVLRVDGHMPGDEITLGAGGGTTDVQVEVKSFVPFHRLEVVLNGRVVASREERDGTREMNFKEQVQVSGPGWICARCSSRLRPTTSTITSWGSHVFNILAHTSPVYLRVPGQELFCAATAVYMLTLIEGAATWAKTLATRPDPERFARVLEVFEDARTQLHRRLHEHSIKHVARPLILHKESSGAL